MITRLLQKIQCYRGRHAYVVRFNSLPPTLGCMCCPWEIHHPFEIEHEKIMRDWATPVEDPRMTR